MVQVEKKTLFWFMAAAFCLMAVVGMWDPVLSNYFDEVFHISNKTRGYLEFPREFPGFMVVAMTGLLAALPIARVGMIASGLCIAGLLGMAAFGGSFVVMVAMMVLISSGVHLNMPVVATITLASTPEGKRGRRLGQIEALTTCGFLLGAGLVWLISHLKPDSGKFPLIFLTSSGFALLAGFCYSRLRLPEVHQKRSRLVLHRKFGLYYWLEFLFGARKQIFLTFGPWVLIRIYGLEVSQIAQLYIVSSLVGVGFKLIAGRAIDHFGERLVLTIDAIMLAVVCLGYGYAKHYFAETTAFYIAAGCFVLDHMLFSLSQARSVYVARISDNPSELSGTLSMGISINHIASMVIPACAGIVWAEFGYERVFLLAMVLAAVILSSVLFLPVKNRNNGTVGNQKVSGGI